MYLILATAYGNFPTFLKVGPLFLLALLIGIPAWRAQARVLAAICGVGCIAAGIAFALSLPEALSSERGFTVTMAAIAILAGMALIFGKRSINT